MRVSCETFKEMVTSGVELSLREIAGAGHPLHLAQDID